MHCRWQRTLVVGSAEAGGQRKFFNLIASYSRKLTCPLFTRRSLFVPDSRHGRDNSAGVQRSNNVSKAQVSIGLADSKGRRGKRWQEGKRAKI